MDDLIKKRDILKANFVQLKKVVTDQKKKEPPPLLEKQVNEFINEITLPELDLNKYSKTDLVVALAERKSHRSFLDEPLDLEELNFLLWATQGVKEVINRNGKSIASFRTVPSAGARHTFETYLVVLNIIDLEPGIYKYSALKNKLYHIYRIKDLSKKIVSATLGQTFTGKSSVVFVWSSIPYRSEWRYNISAHKGILMDAGHVCQNLYLACEALNCGNCAIEAYDQQKMDKLLKLDGIDEMVVYLSPVGKII
jgi:SagB-type dehydrogenase family enzyme